MIELRKTQVMVMLTQTEKALLQRGAGLDERRLSDWMRTLGLKRLRELGLLDAPGQRKKQ